MRVGVWAAGLLGWVSFGPAMAAVPLHLSGFISQSAIYSSDNAFLGRTDDQVGLDYSEAALIVNTSPLTSLSFSTQLLSRNAGSSDIGRLRVDYAFLSWRFWESPDLTHTLIAGRLKAPIGFYNDLRDSPFTRNGVFLPQSLYLDRIRNSTMAADEIMYSGEFRKDLWTFNARLGVGKTLQDQEEINDLFSIPEYMQGRFVNDRARHFQLMIDYDAGRVRMGFSQYFAPLDFSTFVALYNYQLTGTTDVRFNILSFEYNAGDWAVISEVYRALLDYKHYQTGEYSNRPEGIYLQGIFRPNPKWDLYAGYDYSTFDKADRKGEEFFGSRRNFFHLPDYSRFAHDATVGVAFRPSVSWLLKLEYHNVSGTLWMTARDLRASQEQTKHWDIIAFSASWRF